MNKKLQILIITLCLANVVCCQVDQKIDNLRAVVPPSPNSSSLGKFGEWPVSLYTGLPSISVPIYELKGNSLSVPITLSYHAAGIRVGEIASWVGLGWALDAGGVITRSVKGLPDEEGYSTAASHYTTQDNFCGTASPSNYGTQHRVMTAQGTMDSQEDIYNLSALGKSFRLMIKADGTVLTMPYSNIKITRTTQSSQILWTVILEDGTKLLFGGGSAFVEVNTSSQFLDPFVSSWYLKSIISTTGETINLTYVVNPQLNEDAYASEHDVIKYDLTVLGTGVSDLDKSHNNPRQTISPYNLSTIESDLIRVEFVTSAANRLDVKNGSYLSEIKVYSKLNSSYIEDNVFTYNYSTCVAGAESMNGIVAADTAYMHKRLKLQSIEKKTGSGTQTSQKWSFQYNSQNLPSRRSYAQDPWGFYNGALTNTTLLPKVYFGLPATHMGSNITGFMPSLHDSGAEKTPNETMMQAEILNKITFPTGGYTQFDFEANGYQSTKEFFSNKIISPTLTLISSTNPFTQIVDNSFTITKPQYILLTISSAISQSIINGFPSARCDIQILNSSSQVVCGIKDNGGQWFNLLSAGTYTLRISTNVAQAQMGTGTVTINGLLKYLFSLGNQSYTKMVGGLRVKAITDFDGILTNGVNKRFFIYENPLEINPLDDQVDYLTYQIESVCPGSGGGGPTDWQKVTRNISSKCSLGSIQGGTIGYGKVTTLFGINGVNGKTVSIFNSESDQGVSISKVFPYPATESRDWRRGLLLQQSDYNAAGVKIKDLFNSYDFVNKYTITNFASGFSTIQCPTFCVDPDQNCGIAYACYNISTEQVRQLNKTETIYHPDGSNPLTTISNFYYDNSNDLSPTRIETHDSKGLLVKTISRTPLEKTDINAAMTLTANASAAIDTMVVRNIISPVLEQEIWDSNTLRRRILTNYKNWTSLFVGPENVEQQIKINPREIRMMYTKYDVSGNLLQQQKANDVVHSYVYDYTRTYPVAECTGSDTANMAYTSFESDGKGYWTFSSTPTGDITAPTGKKVYSFNGTNNISRSGLVSSTTYIVSYWTKNASAFTITGTVGAATSGRIVNGWKYFEHRITGVTQVIIGSSGLIDEVRLYPDQTLMSTYTYEPTIGVTSHCDPNNRISYYKYDGFGRLILILDQDKNILKKICYNYNGQPETCSVFGNVQKSQAFSRNNCGTGFTGSVITYIVAANSYQATSQAEADLLAQTDVNNNGQAFANATGSCTANAVYTACCSWGSSFSSFALAGTTAVNFSVVVYKMGLAPVWTNVNHVGNLSGAPYLPAATRNATVSEGGRTWQFTITSTGSISIQLQGGTPPADDASIQLSGTYNL